jgi:hypothetical protein
MLNIRKSSTMALVALLVLCAVVAVQAAPRLSQSQAQGVTHKQGAGPLAPQSITQSTDPNTIAAGSSVACQGGATTDNGWWRLFDLDDDHALAGAFTAEDVDYGIETSVGPQNITARVYCLDEGLPFFGVFLVQVGTGSVFHAADANGEFFNVAISAGAACDSASQDMAVELHSDDCLESGTCLQLFIGMNGLGQSGPSYISAEDCGIVDPIDLAGIGFPNAHLVMVVNGDGEAGPEGGDGGDGGPVPASTGVGMMLMIALLLGGTAHFLRRLETKG